mmetsp:Transcript_29764/g.38381  ORF Transcript_29764/g.38381 Transcript_29764/m.38381 type:complete len:98 (+) Transcript_29764:1516-1809(+)
MSFAVSFAELFGARFMPDFPLASATLATPSLSSSLSSSSTTSSQQQLHHQQSFLLIHQVYCLRNGRISRDFLRGLHHYENRIKSHTKHHKKKTHSKH